MTPVDKFFLIALHLLMAHHYFLKQSKKVKGKKHVCSGGTSSKLTKTNTLRISVDFEWTKVIYSASSSNNLW